VGTGGDGRFAVVMGRNNKAEKQTDWIFANVKAAFELSPNLMIVRKSTSSLRGFVSSTEDVIVQVPESITADDVQVVFDFFNVVVLQRLAEVLQVVPSSAPSVAVAPVMAVASPTDLVGAVSTVVDWYPKIVSAFKTTTKTELVATITQQGFDHFEGSTILDHVEGLEKAYVKDYLAIMTSELTIPADKQAIFQAHLNLLPHLRANEFAIYDIVYSVDSGGGCVYVCVVMSNDAAGQTSSFLVANIKATFHLAPNILVMQKTRSVLGGIYESSEVEFKYQDRPVTLSDIDAVFDFFKVAAFKKFADLIGLPADNPKLT